MTKIEPLNVDKPVLLNQHFYMFSNSTSPSNSVPGDGQSYIRSYIVLERRDPKSSSAGLAEVFSS